MTPALQLRRHKRGPTGWTGDHVGSGVGCNSGAMGRTTGPCTGAACGCEPGTEAMGDLRTASAGPVGNGDRSLVTSGAKTGDKATPPGPLFHHSEAGGGEPANGGSSVRTFTTGPTGSVFLGAW